MNYKTALIDNVFFVYWSNAPQPEELRAVMEEVSKVEQRVGGKYIYVSVVAPSSKVPNKEQRNGIFELINLCKKHCQSVHMIMRGSDMQHNLQRVVVQTLLILTRVYDNFLVIHKDTDTVAAEITQRLGKDGAEIIRKATAAGVL